MKLSDYLEQTGESQVAFAGRADIPQSTVNLLCQGTGGTTVGTAIKIIRATGGLVALQDLDPGDKGRAADSAGGEAA